MPDNLKSLLVDDWEKVTKDQKLAPVPSPVPVSQFLHEYRAAELPNRRPGSADADILEEVIAGIREYFNKALGRILLYRFERGQFYEMHRLIEAGSGEHAGKGLVEVYGCEHLLRLFGMFGPFFFLSPFLPALSCVRCNGLPSPYRRSVTRLSDNGFVVMGTQSRCPTLSRTPTWTSRQSAGCAKR